MKTIYKTALVLAFVLSFAGFASAQTEREKGIDYYLKGNYQNAAESLQKAVETDETDRDALLFLGMSFAKLKEDKKAAKALGKADNLPKKESNGNEKIVKFTSKPYASYTDNAHQNNVQGTVSLAVELGYVDIIS